MFNNNSLVLYEKKLLSITGHPVMEAGPIGL